MSNLSKILSIDGGGIRGIIPGQVMVEIEKEFGVQPAEHFDLIAGTSTGGILTCAYLMPDETDASKAKYSTEEVVGFYLDRGGDIFDIPFFHKIRTAAGVLDEKYPATGIEKALKDYFGDTWLKDLLKPCIITSYDITRRKGHFFGQHKALADTVCNFRVRDAARCTSAAPTYFEVEQIWAEDQINTRAEEEAYNLIDGGVFVNNPALVAYAEGRNIFEGETGKAKARDMKILSIGTGFTREAYKYEKAKGWGLAGWVQPVIDVMMSGGADVAAFQLDKIYDAAERPDQYLRVNGDLKDTDIDPAMDCATDENMTKLKEYGIRLFEENREAIQKWLEL